MYRLRSRIVNFRVTDEEFERLKTASAQQGSRCLSDFARSVMLTTAGAPTHSSMSHEPCENRMISFERRLAALESSVEHLADVVVTSNRLALKSES